MERMWRKVNQGFTGRTSKSSTTIQSTDTASSAGFGDPQNVVAVAGLSSAAIGSSTATGRRLASSGQQMSNSFSQHILKNNNTASSERRRRRRRKSRPRRSAERIPPIDDAPEPPPLNALSSCIQQSTTVGGGNPSSTGGNDPTLRQRAVAKLRMFNFHLNWDLHMTQCKPCGPRSSGNIITRRLCRNRRRDDNELYRSNSFKFERFERKDGNELMTDTMRKKISICDDYSLPVDFVKKRPSSFDPGLAEKLPENWTLPSPLSEQVKFLDQQQPSAANTVQHHQSNSNSNQQLHNQTSNPQHPPLPNTVKQKSVKLIEGYSDPKDSKRSNRVHHRRHRKDKRSASICNYKSDSSAPNSSADEDFSIKVPELNSPDSISEDLVRPLQPFHKSPKKLAGGPPDTSKRNPSPYYYSDLLKPKDADKSADKELKQKSRHSTASEPPLTHPVPTDEHIYRKSTSLDVPDVAAGEEDNPPEPTIVAAEPSTPKRYSITEDGVRIIRCNTPSTTTSDDSDCSECQKRREWHAKALALVRQTCNVQPTTTSVEAGQPMPPHRRLGPAAVACACATPPLGDDIDEFFRPRSIFYVHAQGAHECDDCAPPKSGRLSAAAKATGDEMSNGRTRQIYETAFDCRIARSDDDLDDVDRALTSHSVLLPTIDHANNVKSERTKPPSASTRSTAKSRLEGKRLKNSKNQAIQENQKTPTAPAVVDVNASVSQLSNDLENAHIDSNVQASTSHLPMRGYTPSPPSTAPLPMKFPGKHDRFFINSIKSAPNLPSSNPAHPRLNDLRPPALRKKPPTGGSNDSGLLDGSSSYANPPRNRPRPRSVVLESGRILELRKAHRHGGGSGGGGHNYSSTESMATSSSGGSMESLQSSTSEGNRSTTSSESRHSTSLSSHSSESGSSVAFPLRAPLVLHSKLHILSPISDKSSQEQASDASELTKKSSPAAADPTSGDLHIQSQKRRPVPNKTLLQLTDEILGSDSGISLHSREDNKFAVPKLNTSTNADKTEAGVVAALAIGLPQDLRDLPFDMPKLRRRKILLQQDVCTSGSATSVDLGDLPFDMPKLRRRLRMNQPEVASLIVHSESSGISQASSSHSVREDNKVIALDSTAFRQNLTLTLNETKPAKKFSSLDLRGPPSMKGLNLNLISAAPTSAVDLIDVNVPLERQGWYHGSITRIDAESTLRPLTEGSFLIRNCESTKQDFSLSLKGAKGFMHMRIQRNDSGQYILGQFSRPFDSIPEMIRHFCINRLPVRGAEHMCLIEPVIAQLL